MSGPHPANAAARRALLALIDQAGIRPGTRLLVAVSGGSDSMALASAALFVGPRHGYPVASMTVDHGVRPESADEAEQVRARLESMGVDPALTASVSVDASRGGPEGAARDQRYAAIAEAARSLSAVVLAGHTADDQAETVLLGLARGSGARSIRGMPPIGTLPGAPDVPLLRPLLGLRRSDLRAGLSDLGILWVDDPTNAPDSEWRTADGALLRRTALRHGSLPALEKDLGDGVVESLARTARLISADDDALEEWASRARELWGGELPMGELRKLPRAVRTRIVRRAALDAGARGGELMGWHIDHLDELVTGPGGGRGIDLPGVRAMQRGGFLAFERVG